MLKNITPAIFQPTKTILIDDDSFFIDNIKRLLPANINSEVINPYDFCQKSISTKEILYLSNNQLYGKDILSFDSNEIPVSSVVIDHYMKPKCGLEILSEINSPFVQKILISNIVTSNEAIDALNDGLINFYLWKMDRRFIENLSKIILEAQKRFFINLSLTIPNFISDNPLKEECFIEIFDQIKYDYKAIYYKCSNNLRRFYFSDENNCKKIILQIITKNELDQLLDSMQSESVPHDILKLIKNGNMIPCFNSTHRPDGDTWIEYLRPAKSLKGIHKYYYSIYMEHENASNEPLH